MFKVIDRKTKKDGPVNFCINKFYLKILFYINNIRPMAESETEKLFVTFPGNPLPPGSISTQLNSFVKRCGGFENHRPRNITANQFRKSGSTLAFLERRHETASVAAMQTHKKSTAEKYYRLIDKEQQAIKGTKVMKEIYTERVKKLWSQKDIGTLKTVFQEEIAARSVSLDKVRSNRRDLERFAEVQIRDKIRSMWRFGCKLVY